MGIESGFKENIGKIEKTAVPELEGRRKKLDEAIAKSRELSAVLLAIKSPHFKEENLPMMIENYNKDQKDQWVGGEVEKEFKTNKGQRLVIAMDYQGHTRLEG